MNERILAFTNILLNGDQALSQMKILELLKKNKTHLWLSLVIKSQLGHNNLYKLEVEMRKP